MTPSRSSVAFRPVRAALIVVLSLAALAVPACVAGPGVGGSAPLSPPALEAHVAYLAGDALEGRDSGTPGGRATEEYVLRSFHEVGLEQVEYQPFEFVAGSTLLPGSALAIDGTAIEEGRFRPLAFSAAGAGVAPVVFVGYGIDADKLEHRDYRDLDVAGQVAVALSGSPDGGNVHGAFAAHATARAKALAASSRGAAALLLVVAPDAGGKETLPPFSGDDISADVGLPVVAVAESAVAPALGLEPADLRARLDAHEFVSTPLSVGARYDVRVELERRRARNVLGWLTAGAPDARPEVVIVGAHHDHLGRGGSGSRAPDRHGEIHNGADDNASGVAGVIELARSLQPRQEELRRHVLFMTFAAEERGLLGSKHFKQNPRLEPPPLAAAGAGEPPAARPVAMINLDMIGRLRADRVHASGQATSPRWPETLEAARRRDTPELTVTGEQDSNLLGASDHTSFYQMGMPVIFFFTGSHPEYHTPDDDLYRIAGSGERERLLSLDGMERVLELVRGVILDLARRDENLPYAEGVELTPRMRFNVVLRLMPDYGADAEGMRIASVTEDGPADVAGLESGDIIVRFGPTPVRSVRDYMVGLEAAEPGEAIEVEFLRGGERRVVSVTPRALTH